MSEPRLIDANALKEAIRNPKDKRYLSENLVRLFFERIDNAPTVEEVSVIEFKEPLPLVKAQKIVKTLSKRSQGEWIETSDFDEFYGKVYKCTNCNKETLGCSCRNYCPNCGADMKGDADVKP